MKIRTKKSISLLLAICLLAGTLLPIPVFGNSTPEVTVTVSPESLSPSSSPQTVTINISVSQATSFGANYVIHYDSDLVYTAFKSAHLTIIDIEDNGDRLKISVAPHSGSTTDLGTFTFQVPACNAGDTFNLTVEEIEVSYGYPATHLNSVSKTIYVNELPAEQGYTASLSKVETGSNTVVRVGDTWKCLVTAEGKAYNSGAIKVSYSTDTLTFVAPDSLENGLSITEKAGEVTILDYGALKNSGHTYELTFTAKAAGTASATLTSAAFGTSQSAVSGDLTAATLTNTEVEATIQPATHTVTLPGGKPESVAYGQSYTFTPEFENPTLYDYAVVMTMNEITTELTKNDDGSYTIPEVTGDVQIEYHATAKTFPVTYQTTTGVTSLPVGGTAQYNQNYTIALSEEAHYTLAVTDITIGGKNYSFTAQKDGSVIIPGKDITGDVVVTIDRISTTVSVKGSGAVDAAGYETSAEINKSYTLTVEKDANYDYTVTSTVNGKSVYLNESGNTYTISSVTAGPVVFTVEKTVKINNVDVLEYLKINGKSVWLIKNTTDKLDGSVYAYKGSDMLWSDEYEAYCSLVISAAMPEVAAGDLTIVKGDAQEVNYNGDVNQSGKVDANDAQLVYDLYQGLYGDFNTVAMEKFLRADVNASGSVDSLDAAAVISIVLK